MAEEHRGTHMVPVDRSTWEKLQGLMRSNGIRDVRALLRQIVQEAKDKADSEWNPPA